MTTTADRLHRLLPDDPVARELIGVLTGPIGRTAQGRPYLRRAAYERLRDWVPHHLHHGPAVLDATDRLVALEPGCADAASVVRQVVNTAAITAPSDLWLLRHVLSALAHEGLLQRLAAGEVLVPSRIEGIQARELEIDLTLLLSRGYLTTDADGYRLAADSHSQGLAALPPLPRDRPTDLVPAWRARLRGDTAEVPWEAPESLPREAGLWTATASDIELGYRLVPLVLAMASEPNATLPPEAEHLLAAAGLAEGPLRARVLERGPGPFGIIQAYHPYIAQLPTIWARGRGSVHVERSANIVASQRANHRSFTRALDALERFCTHTGHTWSVFIEHALGRAEATRQQHARLARQVTWVGADLEEAPIAAAREQIEQGRLPAAMRLVGSADIGRPETLLAPLADLSLEGGVMIVGNGFHEVRDVDEAGLVEVFRSYEAAGLLLMITEESALSVDVLLDTAYNTYHAGFRYVHARSGQGLRPAIPSPPSVLGPAMPASWTECATRAGYVRAHGWSPRSRRVYPYTPPSGHNPAISVSHLFVPRRIWDALEVESS